MNEIMEVTDTKQVMKCISKFNNCFLRFNIARPIKIIGHIKVMSEDNHYSQKNNLEFSIKKIDIQKTLEYLEYNSNIFNGSVLDFRKCNKKVEIKILTQNGNRVITFYKCGIDLSKKSSYKKQGEIVFKLKFDILPDYRRIKSEFGTVEDK